MHRVAALDILLITYTAAASSTLHPYQHYSLPDDIGEEITALCTSDITEIALTPQVSPRPPDLHTQLAKDPGSSGLSAVNTPAASSVTTNGSPGPTCTSHTNLSIYDTYSGRRIGIVPADQCSLAEPAPPRRKLKRTTVVACVFCRGRKIACGGPVHGASDNTCRCVALRLCVRVCVSATRRLMGFRFG